MGVKYNRLWKLLIDKNMMKKDLREKAGISTNAMAKVSTQHPHIYETY